MSHDAMHPAKGPEIDFVDLRDIDPAMVIAHMSDWRLRVHMPLLSGPWDRAAYDRFIMVKTRYWARDGLGHWAILCDGVYVGWGGFQKEGNDWDYGLVLKADCFGLGMAITRKALEFARADPRIPHVTFLLPPTRTRLGALKRIGAVFDGPVMHDGGQFLRYRLETGGNDAPIFPDPATG
ncbi:GNAT family N-acetyltransferase [Thalassospira sp. GO-4]|jgi:hypothetical protein|uniref:GNAT family N-acetyltransferase n=1 Tax=Thalassospira sp. GO-4 TaxID=2946605 RepID=UPI0020259EF8|nr:GNAT family N-acetyltransferase [Thalassospira sp. GO-4]URK16668.1 GNAT family N-acetyltransferase [Thalassospira sp. GO-4]